MLDRPYIKQVKAKQKKKTNIQILIRKLRMFFNGFSLSIIPGWPDLLCKLQRYWIHRNLTSFVSQINDIHHYVQYKNIVYKTNLKKLLDAN